MPRPVALRTTFKRLRENPYMIIDSATVGRKPHINPCTCEAPAQYHAGTVNEHHERWLLHSRVIEFRIASNIPHPRFGSVIAGTHSHQPWTVVAGWHALSRPRAWASTLHRSTYMPCCSASARHDEEQRRVDRGMKHAGNAIVARMPHVGPQHFLCFPECQLRYYERGHVGTHFYLLLLHHEPPGETTAPG